jgi:hypothetical protein
LTGARGAGLRVNLSVAITARADGLELLNDSGREDLLHHPYAVAVAIGALLHVFGILRADAVASGADLLSRNFDANLGSLVDVL